MFDRIRNAVLLLRRFPQLLIMPIVLWLGDLPLGLIVPGWSAGNATADPVVFLAKVPAILAYMAVYILVMAFLAAGQVHGILIAFADQRLSLSEFWGATRRYGLRLVGLTAIFGFLVLIGFIFSSFLFAALSYVGVFLASACLIGAMVIYAMAMLLIIRDDLTAGDALGAAWRFTWGNRGPVWGQAFALFLCSIGVALIVAGIKFIPGVATVGDLLSTLVSSLLPLIVFADLLRAYPVPPKSETPPSPF